MSKRVTRSITEVANRLIKKNGLITTKLAFNVLARGVSPTLSHSPKHSPPASPRSPVGEELLQQEDAEENEEVERSMTEQQSAAKEEGVVP
jgi:hypothetical protein